VLIGRLVIDDDFPDELDGVVDVRVTELVFGADGLLPAVRRPVLIEGLTAHAAGNSHAGQGSGPLVRVHLDAPVEASNGDDGAGPEASNNGGV
jgi:hypothetical protein